MSNAPVDVLAVMRRDHDHANAYREQHAVDGLLFSDCHEESEQARAAVAELISERDRLSRIACSHAAQILRMRDERDELMLAAENAIGNLITAGTPRPIKGKERAHAMLTAALARCKGGAA